MTLVRAWQVAVEVPRDGAGRLKNSQLAVEVLSRSALGIDPYVGNSARVSTFEAEVVYPGALPRARSAQLAAEVISRSGLGVNPSDGNAARSSTYVVEVAYPPAPIASTQQVAVEVVSRSGLGADPFIGNGARTSTFVVEVVRLANPDAHGDAGCDCTVTAQPVARFYTLRRPGRYK